MGTFRIKQIGYKSRMNPDLFSRKANYLENIKTKACFRNIPAKFFFAYYELIAINSQFESYVTIYNNSIYCFLLSNLDITYGKSTNIQSFTNRCPSDPDYIK